MMMAWLIGSDGSSVQEINLVTDDRENVPVAVITHEELPLARLMAHVPEIGQPPPYIYNGRKVRWRLSKVMRVRSGDGGYPVAIYQQDPAQR